MLESGIFPDSLKIAKIILLFKKGHINSITIDQFHYCQLYQRYLNVLYSISYILILIITIFYQNNNMDFARIIPQS